MFYLKYQALITRTLVNIYFCYKAPKLTCILNQLAVFQLDDAHSRKQLKGLYQHHIRILASRI